ncbi:hypothetical protein FBR02_02575 [Anaerolineae bacterium CFX9]|nr:hypothetical protein [Anaerolineae bacterium CFX9]
MASSRLRMSTWMVFITLGAALLLTLASAAAWLHAENTPIPTTDPQIITEVPLRLVDEDGSEARTGVLRVTATTLVAPGNNAVIRLVLDALGSPAHPAGSQRLSLPSHFFTGSAPLIARLECPTAAFAECTSAQGEPRLSSEGRLDWTWLLTPTAPSGDQPMTIQIAFQDENNHEDITLYSARLSVTIGRPATPMGYIVAVALAGIAVIVTFGGLLLARLRMKAETS